MSQSKEVEPKVGNRYRGNRFNEDTGSFSDAELDSDELKEDSDYEENNKRFPPIRVVPEFKGKKLTKKSHDAWIAANPGRMLLYSDGHVVGSIPLDHPAFEKKKSTVK